MGAKLDDLTGKIQVQNYLGDYQKSEERLSLEGLFEIRCKNDGNLSVDLSSRAFQENPAHEYNASLKKLLPLKTRLAATDRLIDLIVYRLNGLTEEVGIVEGR